MIGRGQMLILRLTALSALVFAAAGCGGAGGSHTYVLAAGSRVGKGIYVTIVSPVAIPTSLMTQRGAKIVGQVHGPQVCSLKQTVKNSLQNGDATSALLKGKTVTLKINGSSPLASTLCALMKKAPFDINRVAGT